VLYRISKNKIIRNYARPSKSFLFTESSKTNPVAMDAIEADVRKLCADAPHWQQIQFQVFWYGVIMWALDALDSQKPLATAKLPIDKIIAMADAEPSSWPTEWLEPFFEQFIQANLNQDQIQDLLEQLDTIFRDCIPTDLDVYSTLANGEELTQEQWKRLYDAVAFLPPAVNQPTEPSHIAHTAPALPAAAAAAAATVAAAPTAAHTMPAEHPKPKYARARTRRTHGRRAITPIRGRRAHTRHHHVANPIQIIKTK
jgi:hypothetical protein